jgi:hypothetical protein
MSAHVKINGKEYPCRQVMGGMIALKRTYGKEVDEIGTDAELLTFLIYSYTRCACLADGVAFDLDFETFAASLELTELVSLQEQITAPNDDGKKK